MTDLSNHAELHLGLLDAVTVVFSLKETGGDKREGEESGAVYNLCEPCQYPPVCSRWTRPVCKVSLSVLWFFQSLRLMVHCILPDISQCKVSKF